MVTRPVRWWFELAVVCAAMATGCAEPSGGGDAGETSAEDTSASDSTDTGGVEDNEILDVRAVLHPEQPMVVDIVVQLARAGEVEVTHVDDPGVVIARIDGDAPAADQTFRLRGLAPATEHEILVASEGAEDAAFAFTTDDPLPGFLPAFQIATTANPAENVYRLFDVGRFNLGEIGGVYLVDPLGVSRWYVGGETTQTGPGAVWTGVKLLDDGSVMFLRNDALIVLDELDALEAPTLEIEASELGLDLLHHDVIRLPNGEFMALSATIRDIDYPGEGPLPTAGDLIVQFDASGQVVWTWDAFDHLDPQRIRGGFEGAGADVPGHDWTHGNAIEYWEDRDLVIISMRHQDWLVGIEHDSGEVAWRLGPEGDFALDTGRWFFHQHSPARQPDTSLLVYDNGVDNPGIADPDERSRAVRYALDLDLLTAAQLWEDDEQDAMSPVMGDADAMPGGNVLVLDSALGFGQGAVHARMREMAPDQDPQRVWALETPPGYYAYRALPTTRMIGVGDPSRTLIPGDPGPPG